MGTLELLTVLRQVAFCSSARKLQKFGGDKRDRTADLLHAMQALSQLSYTPEQDQNYSLKSNSSANRGEEMAECSLKH